MDSSLYSIPPLTQALVVKDNAGQTTFTVNNATDKALSTEFQIEATAPAQASWFQVERPFRVIPPKGAEQVKVTLTGPPEADGTGSFTIVAIWRERSEEFRTKGAAVGCTFKKAAAPVTPVTKGGIPWWVWLIVGGVVLLIAGILFFALRPDPAPQGRSVAVPEVVGMNIEEATALLKEAGFEVKVIPRTTGPEKVGTVVELNPHAASKIARGSEVRVTVRR